MTGAFTRRCTAIALRLVAIAICSTWMSGTAHAQDAESPSTLCLRYVQSYERSMHVPLGLLTAVTFVEAGRPGPDGKPVAWPWTINVGGQGEFFDTKEQAIAEARKLMDEGTRSIDVGCMQINLRYHPHAFQNLEEAFDPAANVAYGAQFLQSLHDLQGSWAKAIERYHSGEGGRQTEYRDKVLAFWNNDARAMIMDTVLAENTDTPYHRAVRDYVTGHFNEALDKYQAIVDGNAKDRIGLLGLAMSYEKLNRQGEARDAYIRYLAVEPTNESVAAHILTDILSLPPADARKELERVVKGGVNRPEFLAALAETTSKTGDDETAITYATAAIDLAPQVAMYRLNAAVLADRLKRNAAAVGYYGQFLELYAASPVIIDTSIDGVRERLKFLQKQL